MGFISYRPSAPKRDFPPTTQMEEGAARRLQFRADVSENVSDSEIFPSKAFHAYLHSAPHLLTWDPKRQTDLIDQ
jgi:hypothetical protein